MVLATDLPGAKLAVSIKLNFIQGVKSHALVALGGGGYGKYVGAPTSVNGDQESDGIYLCHVCDRWSPGPARGIGEKSIE